MDKETLSNYGWIVICVLVLAVMIALASPFGSYVASAVENTTQGLFDVQQGALSAAGIDIADQSFDDANNTESTGYIVPDGCTYTTNSDGTVYNAGEFVKTEPEKHDTLVSTDYTYRYAASDGGWLVSVLDKSKTEYGAIFESINGKPVTTLSCTFQNCSNLTIAPAIPSSVTNLYYTFNNCDNLTDLSDLVIPSSVTKMESTFSGSDSISAVPVIPSSVTDMKKTFQACTSLTGNIEINANPTSYDDCFINTNKSITLSGTSTKLAEIAATANNGNVKVAE